MGELSQTIGKKLENFGNTLFANLGWEMLAQDLPIDCTRSTHKSPTAKSGEKRTHGIDILQSFYNPFSARKEAVIIECKNHQWKDFIPSNLNQWIEELLNTMECASTSPKAAQYLTDTTLTTGILLFNSSDNLYDYVKATDTLKKITIPRRRTPTMLYLADTGRLEKWFSLNNEITRIKQQNKEHNFGIIYPSISGSQWDRQNIITPSYLFSDYIFAGYTKINEHENGTEKVDDADESMTELRENEPTGKLTGISSAVLTGGGLRNNDFVKECMQQNFIFSSMRYKFQHKSLPITVEIDITFKQTDLKINITRTWRTEDDGKDYITPLPGSEQDEYIDYFQNVAYSVYSELLAKQRAGVEVLNKDK